MNSADLDLIVKLRLLIARAANRDSLAWWDDDALTDPAVFVLERTFPHAPLQAARRLALEAARLRHDALCPQQPRSLHLFRLSPDNSDVQALRGYDLHKVDAVTAPIDSIDALRQELAALTGGPVRWRKTRHGVYGELRIEVDKDAAPPSMMDLARALAWAYVEGSPDQVVYPYWQP